MLSTCPNGNPQGGLGRASPSRNGAKGQIRVRKNLGTSQPRLFQAQGDSKGQTSCIVWGGGGEWSQGSLQGRGQGSGQRGPVATLLVDGRRHLHCGGKTGGSGEPASRAGRQCPARGSWEVGFTSWPEDAAHGSQLQLRGEPPSLDPSPHGHCRGAAGMAQNGGTLGASPGRLHSTILLASCHVAL